MTLLPNESAGLTAPRAMWAQTRASARRVGTACATAVVLVLALGALPAFGASVTQKRSIVSGNPAANVLPDPNYDGCSPSGLCVEGRPCYTSDFAPAFSSPACEHEELEAIDNARAKEGVGPMYLPRGYNSLSGDEQLLVVLDLERVGRGLPAFAGIVASPDTVAQRSTRVSGQPAGSFEDPSLPAPFSVGPGTAFAYNCHSDGANSNACEGSGNPGASIAAGGEISALDADYDWMYNDGYGGSNSDCETPQAQSCWGHRDNILGAYPTRTRFISRSSGSSLSTVSRRVAVPVMGAGSLQPNGGGPQGNWTAIFASVSGKVPAFVYSWHHAVANGAGQG
jgi:hypothetical protein